MPQKFLSIKNFEKYQSYTKKNPPWFKIHRSMFGDREFMKLSTHHRFLYVGLIHLAVETNNRIYNDATWIGQRLYIPHTEVDLKPLYRCGFLATSNLSRTLSETETETENTCDLPSIPNRQPKPVAPAKSTETWNAYASAYQARYGSTPVRNKKVNSLLCGLVDRLGTTEAPLVAAFYVGHNDPFYVRSRHPVDALLKSAEGLRTQWATGIKATTGEAKNAERKDDALAQIARVKAAMGEA